jgi:ABC-type uncharacterized transport system permease subunit
MTLTLTFIAALLYLLAAGLLLRRSEPDATVPHKPSLALALLAVMAHASVHWWEISKGTGLQLHFFAALSLVSLGMAALTTSVSLKQRLQTLGVVVFPLAAIFVLMFYFFGDNRPAQLSWQLLTHAMLALLAYATLAIASLLALMLWFQERALRNRQIHGWLRALPPLVHMETLLFRTVGVGFILLTFVLVTGVLFVDNMMAQHLWHKTVLSILSWIVFAGLLFGRWRYGWRGQRAVRLTLIAMGLLLLAYFGSRAVLEMLGRI